MNAPIQGQSTAKTLFLLVSMVCWLIVGASLIYLVPATMNTFRPSETTVVWMETLGRGGYRPLLAIKGGGIALLLAVVGNILWYQTTDATGEESRSRARGRK